MRKIIAKTNKRFDALVALMKSWGFKLDVDDSDPDETGYFVTYRGKDLFAIDEDGVIFPAHGVSPKLDKVANALAKLPTSKIATKGDELIATLGIGKKKGSTANPKQTDAEQFEYMVECLESNGTKCLVSSKTGSASLNGVFWLGKTRDGGLMLVGGEGGYTGDEDFGHKVTEQLAKYAGKPLDNAVSKGLANICKKITNEVFLSPDPNQDNEAILRKAKKLPVTFTGQVKGQSCLFIIDGTKNGFDEKALVIASQSRKLIGKLIPLKNITEVYVIDPQKNWSDFHDTVVELARNIE